MLSYCLNCNKNAERADLTVLKTKNDKTMLSWKCVICGSRRSRFIKNQEASESLSSSCIKTSLRFHYRIIFCLKCIDPLT